MPLRYLQKNGLSEESRYYSTGSTPKPSLKPNRPLTVSQFKEHLPLSARHLADVAVVIFQCSNEHGDVGVGTNGGHHLALLLHRGDAVLFVIFLDGKEGLE